MIKVVYAEGCSITGGAEHKDWRMLPQGLEFSQTTWAAKVQKSCFPRAKYFPTARAASSNSHIRRRAIHYLSQLLEEYSGKEIVFFVQWTDMYRQEVRLPNITRTKNYETYIDKDESLYTTILPIDLPGVTEFSNPIADQAHRNEWLKVNNVLKYFNEYNMYVSSPEVAMYSTLTEIQTLRNFCKLHKIKMYETMAFAELVGRWNKFETTDKFILNLLKTVDPKNTIHYINDETDQFGPQGIHEWAKHQGYKFGPGFHPLEDAHRIWAKLFIDHYQLRKMKKLHD